MRIHSHALVNHSQLQMGLYVKFIGDDDKLISHTVCSMEQIKELTSLADPDKKLPFVGETLSALRQEVGSASTVLGFIGAPWTLAAYSVEGKADK